MVAAFFYVEAGLRRDTRPRSTLLPAIHNEGHRRAIWLRLAIAFSLVMLNPPWARLVYALGGAYVIVIMAEWTLRSRSIRALVHVRKMSPWLAWPMFLFPLILPWLIGGWGPDRVALTWELLAMLASAFINTAGLLMLAFDFTSNGEQIERKEVSGDR